MRGSSSLSASLSSRPCAPCWDNVPDARGHVGASVAGPSPASAPQEWPMSCEWCVHRRGGIFLSSPDEIWPLGPVHTLGKLLCRTPPAPAWRDAGDGDPREVRPFHRPTRVLEEEYHPALIAHLLAHPRIAHNSAKGALVVLPEVAVIGDGHVDISL